MNNQYGKTFRKRLKQIGIIPLIGVYDLMSASIVAKHFEAIFCSGYGFSASQYGLPDEGFITWTDMVNYVERVRTILPNTHVVVDIDDGYGDPNIASTVVRKLERVGASAVILEDQKRPKKCGHLPGKELLEVNTYLNQLNAVLDSRDSMYVIARTDSPNIDEGIDRANRYAEVGVDAIMIMPVVGPASPEGLYTGMRDLVESLDLPVVLYCKDARLMPVDSTVRLARMAQVHAIKYAVADYDMFDALVQEVGDEVVLLCGMAEKPAVAFMDHGAQGYSSGMANFVPKLSLGMHRAHRSGDRAEVERIHSLMVPFEDVRGEEKGKYNAAALHVANEHIGLAGGPVLPMCTDVAESDLVRVRDLTDRLMAEEHAMGGG